jgi:lysocardiolipin and lysophospholipid acyltransferase
MEDSKSEPESKPNGNNDRAFDEKTGNHTLDWLLEGADMGDLQAQVGIVLRAIAIVCNCVAGCVIGALCWVLVRPFSRAASRRLVGAWSQATWAAATLSVFPSTRLVLSGELPNPAAPGVLIANHQMDTDWLYLWEVARAVGAHGNVKVVLLGDIANVPVMGWGIRLFEFVLLDRYNKADATRQIADAARSFAADGVPALFILFPEGTVICDRMLAKSKSFARGRGRPAFERLLSPRVAGLHAAVAAFRAAGVEPLVYDATVAYSSYTGEVPTWEMGYGRETDTDIPNLVKLLKGRAGESVHVHCAPFAAADVLPPDGGDAATLEGWLDERWREKEALLGAFASEGAFPSSRVGPTHALRPPRRPMAVAACLVIAAWSVGATLLPLVLLLCALVPLLLLGLCCCSPAIACAGACALAARSLPSAVATPAAAVDEASEPLKGD